MTEILTPEQILVLAQQVRELLAKESQGVGEVPVVASLDYVFSFPTLEKKGEDERVVEAPLTLLRVSLRKSSTAIEWRQGDTGTWRTLIPIADITGNKGETPIFRTASDGIQWKYDSEGEAAWKMLVPYEVLKLKFSDLTAEQIQIFWRSLPEDILALFQKPANDAAQIALDVASAVEESEILRNAAETLRDSAERERSTFEKERILKETQRVQVEALRASDEETRKREEEARIVEEALRKKAEDERKAQELIRQQQEEQRERETTAALLETETATNRLNALSDHRDEIRDGYWWRWNEETGEWYNTGEIAKGNVMFATFKVDPTTGRLTMFTDLEYTGANFELDQSGKLQVII